jgi:DNA-3-methyladenine glycosylase II
MSEAKFRIAVTPPYRLDYHAEAGLVRREFLLGDAPVVVDLRQPSADGPVHARVVSMAPLPMSRARLRATISKMVCADVDLAEFRRAMASDRPMGALARRLAGLKPLLIPDVWTTLVRAITAQQISSAAAKAVRRKLAERCGTMLPVDGVDVAVPPAPAAVVDLGMEALAAAGLSRRKAEYVHDIGREIVEGRLDTGGLDGQPIEVVIERLAALRGIGVWTAECTAIFALGMRDVLPADDLGIQKSITELYDLRADPKPRDVRIMGERWAGWRSYASVYLWYVRTNRRVLEARD